MACGDTAFDPVKQHILYLLGEKHLRLTPIDLIGALAARFTDLGRTHFRTTIRIMVAQGELTYSHHFSSTHIELCSSGTIRISDRLSLGNSAVHHGSVSSSMNLRVNSGSAFGRGDHPTTLLSLKAIDWISSRGGADGIAKGARALDVGTGTGVLAMAAALLGFEAVVGIDIDRLACHEAKENVRINGLPGKVHIVAGGLEVLGTVSFDLIMANLRPPTLVKIMGMMAKKTNRDGHWVLSGFRPEEAKAVLERLPFGFRPVWSKNNRNWSAIAVQYDQGGC